MNHSLRYCDLAREHVAVTAGQSGGQNRHTSSSHCKLWHISMPTLTGMNDSMAPADVSCATKMTVHFNLFGGTVLKLGTKPHHDAMLDGIDRLDPTGCFALTELGFGNNAVEMQTTATLDLDRDEFVLNTPTTLAQKCAPCTLCPGCTNHGSP